MSAARPLEAQQQPRKSYNAETPLSRLQAALGYAFRRPKEGEEVCMCCVIAVLTLTTVLRNHMVGLNALRDALCRHLLHLLSLWTGLRTQQLQPWQAQRCLAAELT